MMEARLIFMALICLCIAQMALAEDQSYKFGNPAAEQRFVNILKGIRCTVCQNQSLFESNSATAMELRKQVYNLFNAGYSKQEIYNQLQAEYGAAILFAPPVSSTTILLWISPLVMLLAGVVVTWHRYRQSKQCIEGQYAC